jgi:hypothetical protein
MDDDKLHDLILLTVKSGYDLPEDFDFFRFDEIADTYEDEGKDVAYVGYPSDAQFSPMMPEYKPLGLTFRPGVGLQSSHLVDFTFAVTCDINHGASGSPLYNGKGQLIGIVTRGPDEVNPKYCVESKYLKALLK